MLLASGLLVSGSMPLDLVTLIVAFLLHVALSGCYVCGYAGIIEYSPSAEILRVVQTNMPEGTPLETLQVASLSEQSLTGKRVAHLLASRMIVHNNGHLVLTKPGRLAVKACLVYRKTFGIQEEAKG